MVTRVYPEHMQKYFLIIRNLLTQLTISFKMVFMSKNLEKDALEIFNFFKDRFENNGFDNGVKVSDSITSKTKENIKQAITVYGKQNVKKHIALVSKDKFFNGQVEPTGDFSKPFIGSISYFFGHGLQGIMSGRFGTPEDIDADGNIVTKEQKEKLKFNRNFDLFINKWKNLECPWMNTFGYEPRENYKQQYSRLSPEQYQSYLEAKEFRRQKELSMQVKIKKQETDLEG